jgi:hypothetical protein
VIENTRLHQEYVRNERLIQESHAVIGRLAELVPEDILMRFAQEGPWIKN